MIGHFRTAYNDAAFAPVPFNCLMEIPQAGLFKIGKVDRIVHMSHGIDITEAEGDGGFIPVIG